MFELLDVNDQIRKALVQQPQLELIRKLAQKAGMNTSQEEGIAALVQGITTVQELQRAMKK